MRVTARIDEFANANKLDPERFRAECVTAHRPLVLRGFVSQWLEGWDPERPAEHLPKRPIRVLTTCSDGFTIKRAVLSPSDLVRKLQLDPRLPQEGTGWRFAVETEAPELLERWPLPRVYRGRPKYYLMIGQDTITRCHYHTRHHAMICQVHGKKRIVVYPPEDGALLHPHPIWKPHFEISTFDPTASETRRHPSLESAHPSEATLEPGDALFVPAPWWHAVYGIGLTVSATMGWAARWHEHLPHPNLRGLAGSLLWYAWPRLRRVIGATRRTGRDDATANPAITSYF